MKWAMAFIRHFYWLRQGALMADTPLTLAETASVFEMLTFSVC